jgi:isocitrate dehydrogenase
VLKLISRPGCEKIVRYAFEYARRHNRKKVTCFTKDNIMKLTDGLFHKVFDEIASEYSDLENEHWIVDIGAAKLADTPSAFRRGRDAEPVWRYPQRCGRANRRFGWSGR